MRIGFIGQGWIGRAYADDFVQRGFEVVRYALEEPYLINKEAIKNCDVVFIAVPTPTLADKGFDDSILQTVLPLVGEGKIAVIKSTIIPGTTIKLQQQFPNVFILHSPEFLSTATAKEEAANPKRNVIGLPINNSDYQVKAELVMSLLPTAPYSLICDSNTAELIKYTHNFLAFVRVVGVNILYDVVEKLGGNWSTIQTAMKADPDDGGTYSKPIDKKGRGAGGACFIKDYRAFYDLAIKNSIDQKSLEVLKVLEEKNIQLLVDSEKDLDILTEVYGQKI